MTKLENISIDELQEGLDAVEKKKPTQRLILAILYKHGPSVPMIGDWFDMRDETIYRWFTEMEEKPLMDAIYDETRPGRPADLTADQRKTFEAALHVPPTEADLDAPAWTPKLRENIFERSLMLITRFVTSAELCTKPASPGKRRGHSHRPPTRKNVKRLAKTSKKLNRKLPDEYVTVAIDQTKKSVGCDLYRAWFPVGERVKLPYWSSFESVNLLGAVTENAEIYVTSVADSFKSDVTIQFLQALQQEFGEKIHPVMDTATYFTSQKVTNFIDDSAMKVMYVPTGSPDIDPVEEVWRQFKQSLGDRYFGSLEELRPVIWAALRSVNAPEIREYLCP